MSDLPPGWTMVRLGQLVSELRNGIFVSRPGTENTGRPILRISAVRSMTLATDDVRFVPLMSAVPNENNFYISEGDLLFTRYSGNPEYVGACARVRHQTSSILYPDKLIRVRLLPGIADPGYVETMMAAPQTREFIRGLVKTTAGQVGISGHDLRGILVPLAPYDEQLRIVAAVEEQFSRLDAGRAALEKSHRNLDYLRSAVLQRAAADALACSGGRLTLLASALSAPLANGKSVPDGPSSGFPVLRLTAVRKGLIDVAQSKLGAWTESQAAPYLIQKNDYLVVRGNGSKHLVGRGGLVSEDAKIAYPDTLIRIRFDAASVDPGYAALIWNSGAVRAQLEAAARTTAGIYKINQKDLGKISFPVPSLMDQKRIRMEITRALDSIENIEQEIEKQLRRSNLLRSSILAAAFTGKLVLQDEVIAA